MIGQHRQVRDPGADLAVILLGHHAHRLRDVSEIMHHPRGEQLPQRDGPQRRMFARQVEIGRRQLPRTQLIDALDSQPRKLVEQRRKRSIDVAAAVPESIVRLEAQALPTRENDAGARNPIGLLTIDQMSDDIKGAEGIRALGATDPGVGEATQ